MRALLRGTRSDSTVRQVENKLHKEEYLQLEGPVLKSFHLLFKLSHKLVGQIVCGFVCFDLSYIMACFREEH